MAIGFTRAPCCGSKDAAAAAALFETPAPRTLPAVTFEYVFVTVITKQYVQNGNVWIALCCMALLVINLPVALLRRRRCSAVIGVFDCLPNSPRW